MLSTSFADGIPEIAQAKRLGHHLSNRLVETYSHVAPEIETRLLRGLEQRWKQARAQRPVDTRPPRRPGRAHHTPAPLRTLRRSRFSRADRLVRHDLDAIQAPALPVPGAPHVLPMSMTRDQHRPWLPIIATMRKALRPAETPERRAFVQGWA